MSRVTEMQRLVEDLERSYEARMADVADRRHTTAGLLADAHATHADMAVRQQADLARERADLAMSTSESRRRARAMHGAMSAELRSHLRTDRHALAADTGQFLTETSAGHRVMAAEQRQALARGPQVLRLWAIREIQRLGTMRAHMAADQRQMLAAGHRARRADTAHVLADLRSAREEVATQLRTALRFDRVARQRAVRTTVSQHLATRQALASDLRAFSQTWHGFAASMRARHANGTGASMSAWPSAAPSLSGVQMPSEAPPRPFNPGETGSVATGSVATESSTESRTMPSDDMVFSYLADHPDGVRLMELEEHFGVPRIRLSHVIGRLIEDNKAIRDTERKLYFAS